MCLCCTNQRSPGSEGERRGMRTVYLGRRAVILPIIVSLSQKPKEIRGEKHSFSSTSTLVFLLLNSSSGFAKPWSWRKRRKHFMHARKAAASPWRKASGGFCRLAVRLCVSHTVRGCASLRANPPYAPIHARPCLCGSLLLSSLKRATWGESWHMRCVPGQLRPHLPVISGPQLLGCLSFFCQSQWVLGPVTGPQVPKRNVAIAWLRHNHEINSCIKKYKSCCYAWPNKG